MFFMGLGKWWCALRVYVNLTINAIVVKFVNKHNGFRTELVIEPREMV